MKKLNADAKIYVAGHGGLAGSAIVRWLEKAGFSNIVRRTRSELDLTDQRAVAAFFADERPQYVIDAAAKVGGIGANDRDAADFIRENLVIQCNLIDSAWRAGTDKFVFLGSSCIYPKFADQPMREDSLLTGPLEPTNQWYAVAKIAGVKMCQAYRRQHGFNAISLMPTNLYGPGDYFNPKDSHVLPGLMVRFHKAMQDDAPDVTVWGTGKPYREFMHADDLADATLFLLENYDEPDIVNVGVGKDITIAELAELIAEVVGYKGKIRFDPSKADGTPQKLLDVSRLSGLGWRARVSLREGVRDTYAWFCANQAGLRMD